MNWTTADRATLWLANTLSGACLIIVWGICAAQFGTIGLLFGWFPAMMASTVVASLSVDGILKLRGVR